MEEVKDFINKIPIVTRYWCICFFANAFILGYLNGIGVSYIILDYHKVFKKFQIWRLFTNFLFCGGFSYSFLIFVMAFYENLRRLEEYYMRLRRYAEFFMLLFYVMVIFNILYLILHFLLGVHAPVTLTHGMLCALMYIDSKRNPEKMVSFFGFTYKSK